MADSVEVDTGKLRDAARDLDEVASRISGVLSALETTAKLYEGKWGNDDTGHQFADGPTGYVKAAAQYEQGVGGAATMLDNYGQGLTHAADLIDKGETTSSDSFKS